MRALDKIIAIHGSVQRSVTLDKLGLGAALARLTASDSLRLDECLQCKPNSRQERCFVASDSPTFTTLLSN